MSKTKATKAPKPQKTNRHLKEVYKKAHDGSDKIAKAERKKMSGKK